MALTAGFYELYGSEENRSLDFKSGIHTLGEYSARKTFKDMYLKYKAPIHLKVWLDGRLVFDRELQDRNSSIQFEEIKLDAFLDGYSLEFEVTGRGELYEIEFKAKRRERP